LSLFHDDSASLQHASGKLFDRRFRAVVRHGFDEGEATWPPCLAIERNANAAKLDAFSCERLAKLLLGDVVREVADEESSTHPSFCLWGLYPVELPRRKLRRAAVDLVLQLLARPEGRDTTGLDLDLGTGLGVAALAGSRLTNRERAESAQVDSFAFGETFGDRLDERVDRDLDLLSGQVLLLRNDVDQISLLHGLRILLGLFSTVRDTVGRSRFALTR
jgi:hypothetical protein